MNIQHLTAAYRAIVSGRSDAVAAVRPTDGDLVIETGLANAFAASNATAAAAARQLAGPSTGQRAAGGRDAATAALRAQHEAERGLTAGGVARARAGLPPLDWHYEAQCPKAGR